MVTITLPLYHSIYVYLVDQVEQWRRQLDMRGTYSYIRVLPNLKSIRFDCAKHEYVNMSTPLIEHSAGDATEVELQQTYRRLT